MDLPFPTASAPRDGAGLPAELEALRQRVASARGDAPPSTDLLVADLETAYEELRVADEEIRAQHDAIQRLVESQQGLRMQHERSMALLPVPILVTDRNGMVRAVNAAAATLVGVRVSRLVGKPLFTLFSTDDRHDLRRLLVTLGREAAVLRRTATLLTRTGDPLSVEVTAHVETPGSGDGEVSWLVLGAREGLADGPVAVGRSLTRLALLSRGEADRGDLLRTAAVVCREGLGVLAEVSVALGSPLEPSETVSTAHTAQAWDGAQLVVGEGPSEAAFRDGATTVSADVTADARWPRLRHPGEDTTAVVATPVRSGETVVGVLTAYVEELSPGLEERLELFAVTLGGVLREHDLLDEVRRLEDDMQRALASRAVIDQAKGIIMADRRVDADAAWRHLVDLSSTHHVKVREIAAEIVARASGRD